MGRERGRGESRRRRRCSRHRGNKGGGNKERQVARRSAAGQGAAPRTKARPGRAELLAGRDPAGRTHRGSGPDIGGGAVTSAGGGGSERGREEGPAPAAPRPGRRERAPPPAGGEAERPQPSRHGPARAPPPPPPAAGLPTAPPGSRSRPEHRGFPFGAAHTSAHGHLRSAGPKQWRQQLALPGLRAGGEWGPTVLAQQLKGFSELRKRVGFFLLLFFSLSLLFFVRIGRNTFYLFHLVLGSFWLWTSQS